MLKTNSKKARENIQKYILNNFDVSNYPEYKNTNESDFKSVAKVIYEVFLLEKYYLMEYERAHNMSEFDSFRDWAQGLPSIIDTCYYYNRSAREDIANILEESATEKEKHEEKNAEELLTYLIYNALIKEVKRR